MRLLLKFLLTSVLIVLSTQSVDAQYYHRKRFYGDFFGGMTMSSMDMEGNNAYKKLKVGFQVGANFKYRFSYNIELQTGFYLIKKGSLKYDKSETRKEGDPNTLLVKNIKNTVDANYIQIPLNLGFEVPISKANNLFFSAHAGLYGAYGFKGDTRRKGYEGKVPLNDDGTKGVLFDEIRYDDHVKTFTDSNLKRFDYGFNANAALIYEMFVFQFQYDYGWANVAESALGTEWKTRNYALSLGFRF